MLLIQTELVIMIGGSPLKLATQRTRNADPRFLTSNWSATLCWVMVGGVHLSNPSSSSDLLRLWSRLINSAAVARVSSSEEVQINVSSSSLISADCVDFVGQLSDLRLAEHRRFVVFFRKVARCDQQVAFGVKTYA